MKHFGDITQLSGCDLPVVDVITGGSPCQDLSVAGKRAGLDGERSGLFMEQIRIIKEMRERDRSMGRSGFLVRPRFLVWENVPGAFSSNQGEDFRVVLEEICKVADKTAVVPRPEKGKWTPAGCIMGDGWSVAWRVHDAQFWGVPQRRKRISLVADFGGLSAPEICFERKGLSGNFETGGEEGERVASGSEGGVRATGFSYGQSGKARSLGLQEECSPTIRGGSGGNQRPHALIEKRGESVTQSLRAQEHGHQPVICEPTMIEMTSTKNTIVEDGKSPTLTARMGTGGNQVNAVCFQNTGMGWWNQSDVGTTARTPCGGDSVKANICKQRDVVRRLTPLECERLQGFPDGWTDIGEWTDTKGKLHKGSSDSSRYKALGNSIALPFWFWLLRRISAQYERPATLGSLFDGIGGFPLCWERCNGKGTAVWASEIEELPIAVTKKHFPEERGT